VRVNEGAETRIRFGVWDLPRETAKDHAHEYDGNAPNVSLAWIIGFLRDDLWGQIWVGSNNSRCSLMSPSRVMKDNGSAEVNELNHIVRRHDAIVEL